MHILAIVAHPDDAEIFCGGTLAKHAGRGDTVTIAYMTRGEYGSMTGPTEEVAAIRQAEAEDAAAVLGADTRFLDFHDGRVTYSLDSRLRVLDAIRAESPDLLLTHFDDDMHPDHRVTSALVTDAYYMASLPLVETDYPPCDPANVYYFGKPTSSFDPDVFVDVTDHHQAAHEALDRHESQVEWLQEHGGIDAEFDALHDSLEAEARVLGRQAGVEFAEGFTRLHESATEYLS